MEFEPFNKIPRLKRGCVITEKIDGTNAQIAFADDGTMHVGSRNRWITPDNDNYGFARWAFDNEAELRKLGPGRHFGEWWGAEYLTIAQAEAARSAWSAALRGVRLGV